MRTRRSTHLVLAALCVASLLSACGSDDGTDVSSDDGATADTDSGQTTSTAEADMDDTSTTGGGTAPTGGTQVAIDDLAAHLGVEPDAIDIVSVDAVTWSDSSLGCPQRGFMYQQVLTEGTRIILEVDGTTYHYHSGLNADPVRCANPQAPQSVG